VKTILAVALVASQTTYYEAKVTSFGCTSIDAVSQLQKVRSDQKAFQMALMEKQMYGECVTILKGTLVQGSVEAADKSILRVNQQVEPPGYEAPRDDFEIKALKTVTKLLHPDSYREPNEILANLTEFKNNIGANATR
jgi:hypothetical protein